MSNPKRLEDVLNNLRQSAGVTTQVNQINPLTGELWTPDADQSEQAEKYADVQNRISNASQRLSAVGENPGKITDPRNPIEKALNLPEGQNVIFDVFEMLQRIQQSAFALIAPPEVSEGMASYQNWARENNKRLKEAGLLDDSVLITGADGKQRAREITETSAYKQYLKEGGKPITEPGMSENPTYQLEKKFDEVAKIMGGESTLYGGELIRRWLNVDDQQKAKETGELDWTDFAGFYLDVAFLDPGDVVLPFFKTYGKGRTLTEKGVEVVKKSAQESGIKLSKEGLKKLARSGAPGAVKSADDFAKTVKQVSKITFNGADTARVANAGAVSFNRYIWSTAFDGLKFGTRVGNNIITKTLTLADPAMGKAYDKFLKHSLDTLGRGGKEINRIVSEGLNKRDRLLRMLNVDAKNFDRYFDEVYSTRDFSDIKTNLGKIDIDAQSTFDSVSGKLKEIFIDEGTFEMFKEGYLKLDDPSKLEDLFKEAFKRQFSINTKNYYEFMELARKGMNGADFVDYITNDSQKVLNYTPEGELLFRSIFDNYDDVVKVIESENGLKLFQFDADFFDAENKKKLYNIVSERTVKVGDTHIDTFSKNQAKNINKTIKDTLGIDPKRATSVQVRRAFPAMKQPARISYLIEQSAKFNSVSDFAKEFSNELAMVIGYNNPTNAVLATRFIEQLQTLDAVPYSDVRLAVFDLLSEFSEKTLSIKAEMLGVDATGLHRYLDDIKPKPPTIEPLMLREPASVIPKKKPTISKVLRPEDMVTKEVPGAIETQKEFLDIIGKKGVLREELFQTKEVTDWAVNYYKKQGIEVPDNIEELFDKAWFNARYDKALSEVKPLTPDDAKTTIKENMPQNVFDGWFREANSNYKRAIVQIIMDEPKMYNATLNMMWENYKQFNGVDISFEDFLKTDITLYRGGKVGETLLESDVAVSYTLDKSVADKFANRKKGEVFNITIKPIETLGSLNDVGELEVLVPRNPITGKVGIEKTPIQEGVVSLNSAQKKILKSKSANKLGKMGDELVASVEKSADSLGITKLSPEEAQSVIQKTDRNIALDTRHGGVTEMVKVSDVLPFAEFNRVGSPFGDVPKLAQDVKLNGFKEPIIIEVNPETGFAVIGEGNHRLAVAVALGVDEIPVRVLRSKYLEPIQGKGGWFVDNTILPSHKVGGTTYYDFYDAKPSVAGFEGRSVGRVSNVEVSGKLQIDDMLAKRLSDIQEFEKFALDDINNFANKLLKYEIEIGSVKVKLVDLLDPESKKFLSEATGGGKRNVVQAFRRLAETDPNLKAFLDEQTWADLVGKQEYDLLTGQSVLPKSSKPMFSIPAPNFYTPEDLEYFKKLSADPLYIEASERYGDTIKSMQTNIGKIEFGDPDALVKNSIRGYSPHVMRTVNQSGDEVLRTIESVDDEGFVQHLRGMFKKAGIDQANADLFVFGRNKSLGRRTYAMSAREANNIRNAVMVEAVQNSKAWEEIVDEDIRTDIIDYIKRGLFSEDASEAIHTMATRKMSDINYGNRNIKILAQMSFGDVDNQYVQYVPKGKVPTNSALQALTTAQVKQVKRSLQTIADLTGQGNGDYMEKLIDTFKKASTGQGGSIYMDKHIMKHMIPNAKRNAKAYLDFVDQSNNYFKAGKTLSPMFNIQNIIGNWSNMWFSGMDLKDITRGYAESVADYHKFKKLMTRLTNVAGEFSEDMLEGADKKLYDEIMYFMDNGFFTGKTALELEDVRKLWGKTLEDGTVVAETGLQKLAKNTGLKAVSEANMNLNLFNDNVNRLTLFRYAKKNPEYLKELGIPLTGDINKDAMNAVRFALFDPNDLSFFEQDIMKRIVPFYTFQRQNLAFQVQNFIRKSDRYYKVWKAYEGAWNEKGMQTSDLMQYEQDRMLLPIPYLGKDGKYTAVRVSTPFVDALEFMQPDNAFRKFIASTTPLVRAPYEAVTGVSTFTGEPIERYKDEQSKNIPFLTKGQEWGIGQFGIDVPLRAVTNTALTGYNLATGQSEEAMSTFSRATGVIGAERSVIQNEVAKSYEKLEQLDDLIKKVKETKDVPTINDLSKLSTKNKYGEMIEQQKKLNDLINGLKR